MALFRRLFTSKPYYPSTSGPNYPSRLVNHTSDIHFTLMDFIQNPTQYAAQDLRKNFAMDVIENIRSKREMGIVGGSLALNHIKVIGSRATLPQDDYNSMVHKNYIEGCKDFFDDLFGGSSEPLDDENYIDIKAYVKDLKTMDQMLVLLRHPYFQSVDEALRFIPSTLKELHGLRGKTFPLPRSGANQATPDLVLVPDERHVDWKRAYMHLCRTKRENISESIGRIESEDYRRGFTSLYNAGKNGTPYEDTNEIDELKFYANACQNLVRYMKIRSEGDLYQALCRAFPDVPRKVFKLFWTYDGQVNLEFVRPLMSLFKKKERIYL
ncbi:uncharacterized protein LOC121051363 [Rosa chinensis]|uniref:uncharacterized protein LOC121051363 n=1 Tax=Rosa chinensis TaxID=74649 RepID=UPI001AD8FED7|nr:uncharacterized protein LOC121051363 [Rosa chinensis]